MNINKENIEEYIFDYLEGNLTTEQISEFRDYINSDSEAKMELEDWKKSYVSDNIRIDSSEFSSLKKSNKIYYWLSGVAAAFLLGPIFTYSIIGNNIDEPNNQNTSEIKIEDSKVDESINNIEEVETENIVIQEINNNPSEVKLKEIEHIESIKINEDVNTVESREINLDSSETNREIITEKVRINNNEQQPEEKKKAVDVIELNSEGF